jgi:hypothetical protein
MHYEIVGDLGELIDTNDSCVAACYNCLLSYYNQSDHAIIDRRNSSVKEILVSLLNSEIRTKRKGNTDNEGVKYNYPINGGKWTADEYFRNEKKVVFYRHPGEEAEEYLINHGFMLVIRDRENE